MPIGLPLVQEELSMKIELSGATAVLEPVDRASRPVSTPNGTGSQGVAGDRTTFHSGSMQSLVGQALATPEVRQDKVDALRQAVNSGEYKIDPEKIVAGLIAEGGE
jgi:flagellar biosynthesis anti-sigma factor FlgM